MSLCQAVKAGVAIQTSIAMTLEIKCPECGQDGNVPDDAIGRTVTCPSCGSKMIVTDPTATSPGGFAFDPIVAAEPWLPVTSGIDPVSMRSKVLAPAISLIVLATIGIGLALMLIQAHFQMKSMKPMYQDMGKIVGRHSRLNEEDALIVQSSFGLISSMFASAEKTGLIMGLFGIASGGVILAAALSMMRMRWYPLAIAGSVLAMIPVVSPCCLLGLPLGIWSLVVLLRSDVRRSFS